VETFVITGSCCAQSYETGSRKGQSLARLSRRLKVRCGHSRSGDTLHDLRVCNIDENVNRFDIGEVERVRVGNFVMRASGGVATKERYTIFTSPTLLLSSRSTFVQHEASTPLFAGEKKKDGSRYTSPNPT
jgi:hypothetical protein